jgi:hypothetical protein
VWAVYPKLSVFDIAQNGLIEPDAADPAALALYLEGRGLSCGRG